MYPRFKMSIALINEYADSESSVLRSHCASALATDRGWLHDELDLEPCVFSSPSYLG